jgi:hypothetical protein
MFVGHYAVGLAAKRFEPRVSLGTFVLAAMFADVVWCVAMLAGLEHVSYQPGRGAANYLVASNIALSHSLLMDAIWAALFAGGYYLWRRYWRGAWMLFAAVLSHWVLDVLAHRPDMPLAPGLEERIGLGLWSSVPATIVVEGGLWLAAIILYARGTQPRNRAGVIAFWIGIALLTLLWLGNISGPPPQDPRTAPVASLALFGLSIAWAYGMNRLRTPSIQVQCAGAES